MAYTLEEVIGRVDAATEIPHRPLAWTEKVLLGKLMAEVEDRYLPLWEAEYDRITNLYAQPSDGSAVGRNLDSLLDPFFNWVHEVAMLSFLQGQRHGFRLGCTATGQQKSTIDSSALVSAQTDDAAADAVIGKLADTYTPPDLATLPGSDLEGGRAE